jgi:hypothetical protein
MYILHFSRMFCRVFHSRVRNGPQGLTHLQVEVKKSDTAFAAYCHPVNSQQDWWDGMVGVALGQSEIQAAMAGAGLSLARTSFFAVFSVKRWRM